MLGPGGRLAQSADQPQGLTTTTNQISMTPTGEILELQGNSQLPYLLGNLSLMVIEPLPDDARLPKDYRGPTRVIVPAVRTSVAAGEALDLKVLVLASAAPREAAVHWRQMGQGKYQKLPLSRVERGVYAARLGGVNADFGAFEYYVEVKPADGPAVRFPTSAPRMSQTVIVTP